MSSNSQKQEREDYPVDAFAEYQKLKQEDKGDLGKHGVRSYDKILGIGQDDYEKKNTESNIPGSFDPSEGNHSTTVPVNQKISHFLKNSKMNPFATSKSEEKQQSGMMGFKKEDFTNVPGTGAPKDVDSDSDKMNESMKKFHIKSKSGTNDSPVARSSGIGMTNRNMMNDENNNFEAMSDDNMKYGSMHDDRLNYGTMNDDDKMNYGTMNDDQMNYGIMNDDKMKGNDKKNLSMNAESMDYGMTNDDIKDFSEKDETMREGIIKNAMQTSEKDSEMNDSMRRDITMPKSGGMMMDTARGDTMMGMQSHADEAINMPVMMPMEMTEGNNMELSDKNKSLDPMTRQKPADQSESISYPSEITQDPVARTGLGTGENISGDNSNSRRNSANSAGKKNKHKDFPSRRAAVGDQPSGLSADQLKTSGRKLDRSLSIGSEDGSAGAYAEAVGNMPSMVDPSFPTYGHVKQNNDNAIADDEPMNYKMHSSRLHSGRNVSVGSQTHDSDMRDMQDQPPITQETDMGYHSGEGSVPRSQARDKHAKSEDSHHHKTSVMERIKHTFSTKTDEH